MPSKFRELLVWQNAMDLVEAVYRISHRFPDEEKFGLVSQLRRAAVSVPSNIAEGQGRGGRVEFIRYLKIALGSLLELETQLLIAERLKYATKEELSPLVAKAEEIGRMLNGLMRSRTLH